MIRYLKVCVEVQLYCADESGLFYRLLPDRTFVAANEKNAPGRKEAKERVTFLLCTNADGTYKIKSMVIGKFAKPRCFLSQRNKRVSQIIINPFKTN